MNKITSWLVILSGLGTMLALPAYPKNPNDYALMTAHDLQSNGTSNINLINHTGQAVTVNGVFIASFDITTTDDCSACNASVVGGDNMGGAMVAPVQFAVNQAVAIGQNYLYNMIYNGIYYAKVTIPGSYCNLPGCSWPGDSPHKWCLGINATSLNTHYTYSDFTNGTSPAAAVPPYAAAGQQDAQPSYSYNYDLIDPTTFGAGHACLGPIACDDKTLTCQASTLQSESFQAY